MAQSKTSARKPRAASTRPAAPRIPEPEATPVRASTAKGGKAAPVKAPAAAARKAVGKAPSRAAAKAPAKASPTRVAARSATVPDEARRGPPEAGTPGLPERFSFRNRGASIEVVDNDSKRHVSFPKAATGAVARVLTGLFSDASSTKRAADGAEGFPERHENDEVGLRLVRRTVAVDPSHPNKVLGPPKRHPEGYMVSAYPIAIDGRPLGYLIAHAPQRFVLAAPDLQEKHTQHKSFDNAVLRIEILARGFRDRKALAKAG